MQHNKRHFELEPIESSKPGAEFLLTVFLLLSAFSYLRQASRLGTRDTRPVESFQTQVTRSNRARGIFRVENAKISTYIFFVLILFSILDLVGAYQ